MLLLLFKYLSQSLFLRFPYFLQIYLFLFRLDFLFINFLSFVIYRLFISYCFLVSNKSVATRKILFSYCLWYLAEVSGKQSGHREFSQKSKFLFWSGFHRSFNVTNLCSNSFQILLFIDYIVDDLIIYRFFIITVSETIYSSTFSFSGCEYVLYFVLKRTNTVY